MGLDITFQDLLTHSRNHTLDLILSHGIDVNGVEILQQSDDISDHYLVLCKLHIVKAVNSTPSYKYGRTITSTTKDCFVSNLPDLSQFLSISNSSEQLDDVTETDDRCLTACVTSRQRARQNSNKQSSAYLSLFFFWDGLILLLTLRATKPCWFFYHQDVVFEGNLFHNEHKQ